MDLHIWIETHKAEDKMLWKRSAESQCALFLEWAKGAARAEVVSQHRSKSIDLPVVLFTYANGARAQIRDNFYDFKVSVWSPAPVALPASIDGSQEISDCYCEGFPRGTVLGAHVKNPCAFTVKVHRKEDVMALLGVIAAEATS